MKVYIGYTGHWIPGEQSILSSNILFSLVTAKLKQPPQVHFTSMIKSLHLYCLFKAFTCFSKLLTLLLQPPSCHGLAHLLLNSCFPYCLECPFHLRIKLFLQEPNQILLPLRELMF